MYQSLFESALSHPQTRGLDLNSPETTQLRFELIKQKSFLKKFYQDCYLSISKLIPDNVNGKILELGSGAGFLKDYLPSCVTSEVLQIADVDLVIDGQKLPFIDDSLGGIVMLDVFHHLPRVQAFLSEASRCVRQGGIIVMVEPWNTPWSQFIYKHLHHEPFDAGSSGWEFQQGEPLSQANQALPWIVFQRDRLLFEKRFPQWHVAKLNLHSPFCYLLSGGVSFRSFMPGFLYKACNRIEKLINPWMDYWAMFATIKLVRRGDL